MGLPLPQPAPPTCLHRNLGSHSNSCGSHTGSGVCPSSSSLWGGRNQSEVLHTCRRWYRCHEIKTPNQITVITQFRRHAHLAALAPPTNGVWNLLVVTVVVPAPSADLVEVVRRRFRCRPSPWLPGLWGGPGGGWVCLLGRMGDGATSSRQVMAVLSSQGRGDGGMLPSFFNNGTAGNKRDKSMHRLHSGGLCR